MKIRALPAAAFCLAVALCGTAGAQSVTFNGRMGERALLVINGQPRMVAAGASVEGVRLVGFEGENVRVEVGGHTVSLRPGTPVNLGGAASEGTGREIVLPAGPGGHFFGDGSINGRSAHFMVDTGATSVAMSTYDADRFGVDYKNAQRSLAGTANGTTVVYRVSLKSVRVGDVEVYNVEAVVIPTMMTQVLLGNSFLSRFKMTRSNELMRLEKL
jgi:aspartyl protease family protein